MTAPRAPFCALFVAVLGVCCALVWPLPLHLASWHTASSFADSHVWVCDWIARHVLRGDLSGATLEVGYPRMREMRPIAWVPALAAIPFRLVVGPLGAANAVQLVSLPASALAAWALLRRWTAADPWTAAACAACYALSPTLLGTYATGELSNTQAWIPPLYLLAFDTAITAGRGLLPLAATCALAAFTSPYYALALPLLGAGVAARPLLRGPRARALAALVATAAGLAPAWFYYAPTHAVAEGGVFQPARRSVASASALPRPAPVAVVREMLLGTHPVPRNPWDVAHVSYLGVALVAAGAACAARRGRGALAGGALAVSGALLAMGPWLAWDGDYTRVDGRPLVLPAWALERVGYPTRLGGLYFRYAVLAELGLCALVASGLAGLRRAPAWAWALAAIQIGDAVRASGPFWPRPVEAVRARAALEAMHGGDGAVLDLPLQGPTDAALGQGPLLRAVFHGRPTTALPRDVHSTESPDLPSFDDDPGLVRIALGARGYRYVVLETGFAALSFPGPEALAHALGPPWRDGELRIWDLGPAFPSPAVPTR